MAIAANRKITKWTPEDPVFWQTEAQPVAYRTLAITTFALLLSIAIWYMWSAVVVNLNSIGFHLSVNESFCGNS